MELILANRKEIFTIRIFNENELATLCRKWQDFLRLSHWDIAVCIRSSHDMPLQYSQAANHISLEHEKALISVLNPAEFPDGFFSQDMEVSLVHELLHIPLMFFAQPDEDSIEHVLMEAFIEGTAKLLVNLSREAQHD